MSLRLLIRFFILLMIVPLSASQEYIKIKYFYQPKDLVIEKGKYNQTFFIFENTYNEAIYMIKLRYEIPDNFVIYQTEIDEILPRQKKSLKFNVSSTASEGSYNITFWAESINEIEGKKIQSQKYILPVIVIPQKTITDTKYVTQIMTTTTQSIPLEQPTTIQSVLEQPTIQSTPLEQKSEKKQIINENFRIILIIFVILFLVIIFFVLSR